MWWACTEEETQVTEDWRAQARPHHARYLAPVPRNPCPFAIPFLTLAHWPGLIRNGQLNILLSSRCVSWLPTYPGAPQGHWWAQAPSSGLRLSVAALLMFVVVGGCDRSFCCLSTSWPFEVAAPWASLGTLCISENDTCLWRSRI